MWAIYYCRDLQSLPKNAALRKLNDLIKRARLAKVHAYIISELRNEMPAMFGKESKKKDLIKNIGNIYDRLQREHQISPGDFPDIKKMQEVLQNQDFTKFHSLKPQLLETVDRMLAIDIAKLMGMIPQEEQELVSEPLIKGKLTFDLFIFWLWLVEFQIVCYFLGGAFVGIEDTISPFGYKKGEGIDAGFGEVDWICNRDRARTDPLFETLNPINGKISGAGKTFKKFYSCG